MTIRAKPKTTKKRNPQDATRRNVRASAARDAALDARLDRLSADIRNLMETVKVLQQGPHPREILRHGRDCPHRGDPLTDPRPEGCVCP